MELRKRGRINPPDMVARHESHALARKSIHDDLRRRASEPFPPAADYTHLCTPIKDQGQCGSCWDFSGIGVIEGAHLKAGTLPAPTAGSQLSEQYVLDGCVGQNGGCDGDDNTTVLSDAKSHGVPLSSAYGDYTASPGRCRLPLSSRRRICSAAADLYTLADWGFVGERTGVPSVSLIKASLDLYGPLGAAVAADDSFETWGDRNPAKQNPFLGSGSTSINHDIVLAGWDDQVSAWLLRNSWGPNWGIGGWMWIDYHANLVGYEAVWAKAGPVIPAVVPPPGPGPVPPPVPRPWCHPAAKRLVVEFLRGLTDFLGETS